MCKIEASSNHIGCSKGQLPLTETMKCQLNGYTCTMGDGPDCCVSRNAETRDCIPCDETWQIKPPNTDYTTPGKCDFEGGK